MSTDSQSLTAMSAEAITNIFRKGDSCRYSLSLETTGAVDKLAGLLQNCDDPIIQINIFTVLSKLAEFGSPETVDKVLQSIRFDQLAELLSHNAQEWHECMFAILMSLIKAGKSKAVERMFAFEIEKNLIKLLENGSEVVQHHAIVTLKAFYEMEGPPPANSSLRPANLRLLPWQVRLRLETFVLSDRSVPLSPKPQTFEDVIHRVLDGGHMPCVVDIVELGNKACLERMLSLQAVEKLVKLEKTSGGSGETLTEFLKGMDKCKHLSIAERKLMKQQVVRKVRAALKGHKFETKILAALD